MNNDDKNILSKLNKVPVQLPDDDFFESLKVHVVDKINTETKIVPFYNRISFRAAAAIVILITIGAVYFLRTPKQEIPQQQQAKVDFSSVSKSDILAYIEENSEEFETEDLVSALAEVPSIENESQESETSDMAQTKVKSSSTQKLWNEIKDEDILRYLDEQGEDLDEELILGS